MTSSGDDTEGLVGKQVGNYNATRLLGRGSMGEVYQASHPILNKEVAIKVLSEDLSAYPELVSRFRREARAIARIKHPAIVEAFDFGNLADGRCYYVMELLEGYNLADYMHGRGPMDWQECLDIALPLMEGLSTAHEAGFIHRDIKPDNIFLVRTEEGKLFPKIIDFGITKLKDPDGQGDSVVTRIDAVMGTPLYMSPEQAPGSTETVGAWSDIYSTAATLYHLYCGKPPFYSDNPLELMLMHTWSPPPPAHEIRAEIPRQASDVLMKALSKKPSERFESMQAFSDALLTASSGVEIIPVEEAGGFEDTVLEGVALEAPPDLEGDERGSAAADVDEPGGARSQVAPDGSVSENPEDAGTATPRSWPSDGGGAPPAGAGENGGGAGTGDPTSEAPPLEARQARAELTSLSGAASEHVLDARPPAGTLFRRGRSRLPWLMGGFAAVLLAAGALFLLIRPDSTGEPPVPRLTGLASTARHGCGVARSGALYCWGRNNYGQVGTGDTRARAYPTLVKGIDPVAAVATGGRHTCALLVDRSIWCWGKNANGQLGDGTTGDRREPVRVADLGRATEISAGGEHTCALLEDNTLRCWGSNQYGQVGHGKLGGNSTRPTQPSDLQAIVAVTAGGFHTCAITANGSGWCWGRNDVGQLGLGHQEPGTTPAKVLGISDAVHLSAGGAHTCAVLQDGSARCWGNNASGQLGDGKHRSASRAVRVVGLSKITGISAGGGYLGGHTCAVTSDGAVHCFGNNTAGQVGRETDVLVQLQPFRVVGLQDAIQIQAAGQHSCAVLRSGDAMCWGLNSDGQLGDGTRVDRPQPAPLILSR